MSTKPSQQRDRLHQFLTGNMIIGVLVCAAAVYFLITGEYADLSSRQATEALLNKTALGGIMFATVCWYLDQFARPILRISRHHSQ